MRVAHNGICGSDLHGYYSAATFVPTQPHPLTGVCAPVVLGHQFGGTVTEIGSGVDADVVGRNVAVRPSYTCGTCAAWQRGLPNIEYRPFTDCPGRAGGSPS